MTVLARPSSPVTQASVGRPYRDRLHRCDRPVLLLALLTILSSCSDNPRRPSCDDCTVFIHRAAVLATGDGEDALVSRVVAVAYARSSYFIFDWSDKGRLRRYATDGRFVGMIGRQGYGPGEFHTPAVVFPWGQKDIGIIDWDHHRLTVLDPVEKKVATTHTLPPFHILGDTKILPDGRMIVVGVSFTDESAGLPLHLLDSEGRLVRSLGADPIIVGDWDTGVFVRLTALSSGGALWSAPRGDYRIERWDTTGILLQTIVRNVPWFPPVERVVPITAHRDRPPTSHMAGVWEDNHGLLWVFVNVPRAGWKEELVESDTPRPGFPYRIRSTPEMMFVTHVEVVDPVSEVLVASGLIPMGISQVLANGEAVSTITDDDRPQVVVWRLSLKPLEGG